MGLILMLYQPRRARESPLYHIVEDNLETFLSETGASPEYHPAPFVEPSMRAFLECGVPRFGVVRFKCPSCDRSLFVPFSCKRRGVCPSCDAKRSVATVSHAMDELLPRVPCRQWVLVVPKRLRYFIHHNPSLAGELSHILASILGRFYNRALKNASMSGFDKLASPIQIHFIQSFGFRLNLHLHFHAVVSDGVFQLAEEGSHKKLLFLPAPGMDSQVTERLMNILRQLCRARHNCYSTAMDLLQHGIDRSVIALWLGHESVETTQIYIHANLQLKEKVLAKTTPWAYVQDVSGHTIATWPSSKAKWVLSR